MPAEPLPQREPGEEDALPIPTSYNVAAGQVEQAQTQLYANNDDAPRVPWSGLNDLVGPALLGEMWVIGGRPAHGKTTFMLNWFQYLVDRGQPVLYMGTESPAETLRRRWAAWRLGYPVAAVLENDWRNLPGDAQQKLFLELQEQAERYHNVAWFGDVPDLDPVVLVKHLRAAMKHGIQVIVLDHIHRVNLGGSAGEQTFRLGELTRVLKMWALKAKAVVLVAAQLNRPERVPLADLVPPPLQALKGSGRLEEESDVVLFPHRTKRADCTVEELHAVARGERPITDVRAENTMAVKVAKHRRRGDKVDFTAFLHVDGRGGLTDQAPIWRSATMSK